MNIELCGELKTILLMKIRLDYKLNLIRKEEKKSLLTKIKEVAKQQKKRR